ncbi:MAG: CbtA family protein [Bryobacteraceae bacterium]
MGQFRSLMRVAILSGALAGTVLFVYQYFLVVPRIIAAESYENEGTEAGNHEHPEWKPQGGFQRNVLTAAGTILAGMGFAAVLVAAVSLTGASITVLRGLLWGLAGFLCFVAAPALGLPPVPPGVPVADLTERQLWWTATVTATAVGLFMLTKVRPNRLFGLFGAIFLLLPHMIGAPRSLAPHVIPEGLVQEFAIASVVGNGLFWVVLGLLGGFLLQSLPSNKARDPLL